MTKKIILLNGLVEISGISHYKDEDGEVIFKIPNVREFDQFIARTLCESSAELTGGAVKFLRLNAGYTQEEIADLMQITRQTVNRWENAGFNDLPKEVVFRLLIAEKLQLKSVWEMGTYYMLNKIKPPTDNFVISIVYDKKTGYQLQNKDNFDHVKINNDGRGIYKVKSAQTPI